MPKDTTVVELSDDIRALEKQMDELLLELSRKHRIIIKDLEYVRPYRTEKGQFSNARVKINIDIV